MAAEPGAARAAVFLDRDGTINEDPGYIKDPSVVRLFEGSRRALARLRAAGLAIVIVSNQSGIGRGWISPEELDSVNRRVFDLAGVRPDGIYFCPHHPVAAEGSFRVACACRKPATGLVDRAIGELGLDRGRSFLVGDSDGDVGCGLDAGLTTILVLTGRGRQTLERIQAGQSREPHHVADDLLAAALWIESRMSARAIGTGR